MSELHCGSKNLTPSLNQKLLLAYWIIFCAAVWRCNGSGFC